MREENLRTIHGIHSNAGDILWNLIMDNEDHKKIVFRIVGDANRYFKNVTDINNLQMKQHVMGLVRNHFLDRCAKYDLGDANSFLRNVITYIYKKNAAEVRSLKLEEQRAKSRKQHLERLKKRTIN